MRSVVWPFLCGLVIVCLCVFAWGVWGVVWVWCEGVCECVYVCLLGVSGVFLWVCCEVVSECVCECGCIVCAWGVFVAVCAL